MPTFLSFPTAPLSRPVVGVTDDKLAALDLLSDAIEPSLTFALQETVADGIAGQPCDCTATCGNDEPAASARRLRDS